VARKHPSYTVTITVMLFLLPGGVEEVGVEDVRRRKSLLFSFPSQPDDSEARFGKKKKKICAKNGLQLSSGTNNVFLGRPSAGAQQSLCECNKLC
jgi:hypothetical protein